jgi:hypothetical protein
VSGKEKERHIGNEKEKKWKRNPSKSTHANVYEAVKYINNGR